MEMNQTLKMTKLEKQVLREAFAGYLPDEILWRQKDGMSDAGWNGMGRGNQSAYREVYE